MRVWAWDLDLDRARRPDLDPHVRTCAREGLVCLAFNKLERNENNLAFHRSTTENSIQSLFLLRLKIMVG